MRGARRLEHVAPHAWLIIVHMLGCRGGLACASAAAPVPQASAEERWARRWSRYAKRGAGAARAEGKGLVRTFWGAVETGVAENEEVE
jgi:hypothetical protein